MPDLHAARAPGPVRHRREPVRRPRRGDQHHAADPAAPGRRGDPPRPQPLGRRGRRPRRSRRTSQGVAVSSYQGGHVEYFTYLVELLRERGAGHVKVYGGGGGVIVPRGDRAAARARRRPDLLARGRPAARPARDDQHDGRATCDVDLAAEPPGVVRRRCSPATTAALARAITAGRGRAAAGRARRPRRGAPAPVPVLGITGTGGSGKSSLTDELVRRFRLDQEDKLRDRGARRRPDPAPRRRRAARRPDPDERPRPATAGVLPLAGHPRRRRRAARARSATRSRRCKAAGFDLVIVETPGHRAGRRRRSCRSSTCSLYVMTPEFGAASQLEKIDMLDFADVVAINKFERRGAEDARRDVRRQLVRNREAFGATWEEMPVFGTSAARFNDDGVTALYQHLRGLLAEHGPARRRRAGCRASTRKTSTRARRGRAARRGCATSPRSPRPCAATTPRPSEQADVGPRAASTCATAAAALADGRRRRAASSSTCWRGRRAGAAGRGRGAARRVARGRSRRTPATSWSYAVRDRELHTPLTRETLSGNQVPRVALPRYDRRRRAAAVPAPRRTCPATSRSPPGCSRSSARARTRRGCSPARATPFRTNRRFHLPVRGPAGDPAVDRVRLGDAVRPRPRRARPTSTARSAPPACRSPRSTT